VRNNSLSFSALRQVCLTYVVPNYNRRVLLQSKHDKSQALYDAAISKTTNVLITNQSNQGEMLTSKHAQSPMHYATRRQRESDPSYSLS
jgi:hypothetical protein